MNTHRNFHVQGLGTGLWQERQYNSTTELRGNRLAEIRQLNEILVNEGTCLEEAMKEA